MTSTLRVKSTVHWIYWPQLLSVQWASCPSAEGSQRYWSCRIHVLAWPSGSPVHTLLVRLRTSRQWTASCWEPRHRPQDGGRFQRRRWLCQGEGHREVCSRGLVQWGTARRQTLETRGTQPREGETEKWTRRMPWRHVHIYPMLCWVLLFSYWNIVEFIE